MSGGLICRADKARKQAAAAETDESVSAEDFVAKLRSEADAEVAVMTWKWHHKLKTYSEKEIERLTKLRNKAAGKAAESSSLGPKAGKKAAKKLTLKRREEYSALIEKLTAAAAMASKEMNDLAAAIQ